ncbi:MAG: hypothetical protein K0R38_467 [Polyangiaceae bacterium]|nr:hypothetical protein [Polyangiaceae bacterium]
MSNPNDRNRYGHQRGDRTRSPGWNRERDEDPNEDRNMWRAGDEDGGWARGRHPQENDWAHNNGGANRFERGNEQRYPDAAYGLSEGPPRRGYGTEIFGESGLGEPNPGQRFRAANSGRGDYEAGDYERSDYNRGIYGGGRPAYDSSRDYAHGFGPNHGFGYGRGSASDQGRDPGRGGGYGSYAGGYQGSTGARGGVSSYSPTGLDRDRLGARGNLGYGRELGGYAGRGPKGYKRTDERIREDVCERLSQDDEVDASEISVRVEGGEVTLEGSVETRRQKHRAEELASEVLGVDDVHNSVRVRKSMLTELKDKVTGDEQPTGGHAGSGTKTTAGSGIARSIDHNRH